VTVRVIRVVVQEFALHALAGRLGLGPPLGLVFAAEA
jgi:hypothetical protein